MTVSKGARKIFKHALYLLFSPVGLVNGITSLFWVLLAALLMLNVGYWVLRLRSAAAAA